MLAMYSNAGWLFRCEHPANASIARRAGTPRWNRALDTDHPEVDRRGLAQEGKGALLVPLRPGLRDVEAEAVVGEVPVQYRLVEARETARDEKGRQGHGSTDEHARLEHDRDEGGKGYHRLPAHDDRP